MKILFVTTTYPERGRPTTGFPNYLHRVSLALVQMGHQPVILASGGRTSHRVEEGIDIWTIRVERVNCRYQTLDYLVNALNRGFLLNKKIDKMVKELSIDIVQFTSLEGIAIFYKGTVPAVLRLSSYAKIAFSTYQTCSYWNVKVMSFIERLSSRRCDAVFAPCRNTAQAFGKDCKRTVHVIETPFINDVKEYDMTYVKNNLSNKKYVLFFGTLYAEKGILVIADILEKFLQDNPQYYFVFIGEIGYFNGKDCIELLMEKAGKYKDRVIIWGALPHQQLYPIIMEADFIVLPSLMENLSNACIEAMYFKKVVIGTDGASFEQLIQHKRNGLLCKIADSQDLLHKMQEAASMDTESKRQMGRKARDRIDRLRPEYAVRRLLQFYNCVLENNQKYK